MAMDPRSESLIAKAKLTLTDINHNLHSSPHSWPTFTATIRTITTHISSTPLLEIPSRNEESTWLLTQIQSFAFFDADNGPIPDLAAWCEHGWDSVLHYDHYNPSALQGIGEAWLGKSQYYLARIHEEEVDLSDEELERAIRRDSGVYAEARRCLAPAVEYLGRAVDAAGQKGRLTGGLLVKVSFAVPEVAEGASADVRHHDSVRRRV